MLPYLLLILMLGLPAIILLVAGVWLVRKNYSPAHHLVGVVFIVLVLLSLLVVIGVVFVLEFLTVATIDTSGTESVPTVIPSPSPIPASES